MPRELKQIERTILYKGQPTEIVMKEMLFNESEAYMAQYSKPDGSIDSAGLWEKRLSRCILSPPELSSVTGIRELTVKEATLLKAMWLELNEGTKEDFLQKPKPAD